ncbi:hypothetical protein GE21DRAFT_1310502 [Neurospora crassa]|nr:hypothetical protein GE21DRAFT_1310502 [Neurospora crassa]
MSGSTRKLVYGLQVQGVRQRRRRGRSRIRVHEFMTRRASENGRKGGTKARRVNLSGVLLVRVAGRWSREHKSTGGGGEVERQTSRGEDLQRTTSPKGSAGKPSCELGRRSRRKG